MLIVDSQVHVWETDHPEAIPRHGDRPLTPDDALAEMRAARVDRTMLVPPYWIGYENGFALTAAQAHPDRFAVMGRFDIAAAPNAARVANWRSQPGMLGVRLLLNTPELRQYLVPGPGDCFWTAAEACGLPVMLHVPGDMEAIGRLAQRFPALRLAVDHMGIGRSVRGDAAFTHIASLLALAARTNVAIKLSCAPIFSALPYPYRDVQVYLRRLFDAFGPQRLFWGSDLSRLPCSYGLCVRLFTEELAWLAGEDLAAVMGGSLCAWSGWALPHNA